MTVKQFFKSTTFKCIAALLSILLVCGVFLTIMNGLLEVTDGERLQRAIGKMYPGIKVTVYGLDDDGNEIEIDSKVSKPKSFVGEAIKYGSTSEISAAYKVVYTENDVEVVNYLVTSKGFGGYDSGWVNCNVAIEVKDGKIEGIYKVSIESNQGQSFINRVGEDALAQFSELYEDGISYSQDLITKATTQATKNAICNAVNGALTYVKAEILGEEIIEIPYSDYIDMDATTFDKDERKFTVVTKKSLMPNPFTIEIVVSEDYKIASYTVVTEGTTNTSRYVMNPSVLDGTLFTGKDLAGIEALIGSGDIGAVDASLKTGATESNFLCGYAAAFALANVDDYISGKLPLEPGEPPVDEPPVDEPPVVDPPVVAWEDLQYTEYIDNSVEFDADTRTFTVKTVSLDYMPHVFTIEIVVAEDKTIESFKIVENGSTDGFEADMHPEILDETFFNGMSLEDIEALIDGFVVGDEEIEGIDGQLQTGASRSNFVCTYACAFALANYDAYMGNGESSNTPAYEEYVDSVDFNDATRTFTIETVSLGYMPHVFTIEIVVAEDKTIESFKIVENGSTEGFEADMHPEILDETFFNGMSLEDIEALINGFAVGDEEIEGVDGQLQTGATRSNFICAYACAYALANYDAFMGGNA